MKREAGRDLRLLTAPLRLRPDFIIAGEAKCGTTSLYRYLVQHPDIAPADVKEPRNFLEYGASPLLCRMHYPLVFRRWRAALSGRRLLTGEASAEYFSKGRVPAAVASVVPRARVIVLLRNPVTRALSDYGMFRREGLVEEPFDEIAARTLAWLRDPGLAPLVEAASTLEHNPVRFLHRGLYLRPLETWKRHFPDVMVVKSEDLFSDPRGTVEGILRSLELDDQPLFDTKAYRRAPELPAVSPGVLRDLAAFYRPHNARLYTFLGRDLEWEKETSLLLERAQGQEGSGP